MVVKVYQEVYMQDYTSLTHSKSLTKRAVLFINHGKEPRAPQRRDVMKKLIFPVSIFLLLFWEINAGAELYVYFDEPSYLKALSSFGYGSLTENFDGPAWDGVRRTIDHPVSAPSVTSSGITWSSYEAPGHGASNVGVTTSSLDGTDWYLYSSAFRTYGFQSFYDHVFPDALIGASSTTLYSPGVFFHVTP